MTSGDGTEQRQRRAHVDLKEAPHDELLEYDVPRAMERPRSTRSERLDTTGTGPSGRDGRVRHRHASTHAPSLQTVSQSANESAARTHLRPAEAPSTQIGRRRDLEMVTPEVSTKSASQNVVALKNKMGHQLDAGER